MVWATIADVQSVTGQTVTQTDVDQARVLVELHVGRLQADTTTLTTRDAYWLKVAVAFQAVAVNSGDTGGDIGLLVIDGLTVQARETKGSPDLNALAFRAVQQLSWMRPGSMKVGIGRVQDREMVHETVVFDEDEGGSWTQWRPI